MASNHNEQEPQAGGGGHFIIPGPILGKVFFALLILTFLTVAASRMHLGVFEAPVAFGIAIIKAMLVMMYFMGLKYDEKLNRLIFSLGFFFLALLFFFCWLDVYTRMHWVSTL
jgi:cytochrome c oxidase subunit 4